MNLSLLIVLMLVPSFAFASPGALAGVLLFLVVGSFLFCSLLTWLVLRGPLIAMKRRKLKPGEEVGHLSILGWVFGITLGILMSAFAIVIAIHPGNPTSATQWLGGLIVIEIIGVRFILSMYML